jgi:hypothetical protein
MLLRLGLGLRLRRFGLRLGFGLGLGLGLQLGWLRYTYQEFRFDPTPLASVHACVEVPAALLLHSSHAHKRDEPVRETNQ